MKKIVVTTKKEDMDKVTKIFENRFFTSEIKGECAVITSYIPDNELDEIIKKLDDVVDFRFKDSLIEVSSPFFVKSSVLERIEKREGIKGKLPVEKLLESVKIYTSVDFGKVTLAGIAGFIAMMGLFMNNVALVIGAMLLSPILGPIYAFAINLAVGDAKDSMKSILNLLVMIFFVIAISVISTFILSGVMDIRKTPEIITRLSANPVYVLIAVLLGFASILALSKGVSESIAGVAIAVAILPPAVVFGICIVAFPWNFTAPLVLTLDNIIGLMIGSLLSVLVLDIGPRKYYEKNVAKKFIRRVFYVLVLLIAILTAISLYI